MQDQDLCDSPSSDLSKVLIQGLPVAVSGSFSVDFSGFGKETKALSMLEMVCQHSYTGITIPANRSCRDSAYTNEFFYQNPMGFPEQNKLYWQKDSLARIIASTPGLSWA